MKFLFPAIFVLISAFTSHLIAGASGVLTYEVVDGTKIRITDCDVAASGEVIIPATIESKPVVYIGNSAFYNCSSITRIHIPENVEIIGGHAFYGCSSLQSVLFPTTLDTTIASGIQGSAFENCTNLTRVFFKGDAPSLFGTDVFKNTASSGITIYYRWGSSGFTSGTWQGYPSESIDFQHGLRVIGSTTETIEIDDCSTTTVGTVYIPSTLMGLPVTSIKSGSFSGCTGVTRISLPDSITHIGNSAFYECSGLTTFTIPSQVTQIEDEAFLDCWNLASIYFAGTAPQLGVDVFDGIGSGFKIYFLHANEQGFNDDDRPMWVELQSKLVEYNGLFTFDIRSETVSISDYPTTETGVLTVPDTLVGKPVTRVGPFGFANCTGLTEVILPDSVTSISDKGFEGCSGLNRMVLPPNLEYIGVQAFKDCTGIGTLTFTDEILQIKFGAFWGCSNLKSVFFDGRSPSLGTNVFYNTHAGFTVYYRDGVAGFEAPWNGLTPVAYTLPYSIRVVNEEIEITDYPEDEPGAVDILSKIVGKPVTRIAKQAFRSCSEITSVSIPASVSYIGVDDFYGVFYACLKLDDISVAPGIHDYSSLDGVLFNKVKTTLIHYPARKSGPHYEVPNSVEQIDPRAFEFSDYVKTVIFPESLTSIGRAAFSQSEITHLIFRGNMPTDAPNLFHATPSALKIYHSDQKSGYPATWQAVPVESFDGRFTFSVRTYFLSSYFIAITDFPTDTVGSVNIPSTLVDLSVENIESRAFYQCNDLTSITIPSTVDTIKDDAFGSCANLESFFVAAGNTHFSSLDSILFKGATELLKCPRKKMGGYVIPTHIETIADDAFRGCSQLTQIKFPDTLREIGSSAFNSCAALTKITIPDQATSVGQYAFAGCSDLKQAVFLGDGTSGGSSILDDDSFISTHTNFRIYYLSTKSGFTSPTWHGYPTTKINLSTHPAALWLLDYDLAYNADLSDDESGDGVNLLMNYALDLNPFADQSAQLPVPVIGTSTMEMTYYAGSDGVTYRVEVSPDLTTDSWTISGVTPSGPDANGHIIAVFNQSGPRMFMRLKVSD